MSSRRDLAAQQQRLAAEQVQYAKQCQFWTRSLDRNDSDSAAVVLLNRQLHKLKKILDPNVLLDIGEGLIRLAKDGSDTLVNENGESMKGVDQSEEAVQFLLRSKLRRKLLNRIFRRTNRLAAAMDGNLEIPAAPKYGDLRLKCDPKVVTEAYEIQMQKDTIHLAMATKTDLDDLLGTSSVDFNPPEIDSGNVKEEMIVVTSEEKPEDQEKEEDVAAPEDPKVQADDPKSSEGAEEGKTDPPVVTSTEGKTQERALTDGDPFHFRSALLKDYKDAYEQAVDKKGNASYTLFMDQDAEQTPEYLGAGVGATARHMTSKEREVEYHRWQTTLLARIPEQPTFADLGLEHRVFNLEERRQKLKSSSGDKDRSSNEAKHESEDKDDAEEKVDEKEDGAMEVDKETPKETTDDEDEDDTDNEAEEEDNAKENKDKETGEEEEEDKTPPQVVRPISLVAVPSFYEQDLRRIKNVHADLIQVSLQDHSANRLKDCTNEYNTAFKASVELLKRRNHISEQIRAIVYEARRHGAQPGMMHVNSERAHWHHRRQQFENQKLNTMLPSRNNRPIQGTNLTQRYRSLPDRSGISDVVGSCLGDVVDAVEAISVGMIRNEIFSERFVPPSSEGNENETTARLRQMEAARRNELNEVTLRINQLEEVRKKAWRKVMKTKAELDLPHQHVSHGGAVQTIHVNMSNYGSIPVPVLTQGGLLTLPTDSLGSSSIATYTPKARNPGPTMMVKRPRAKDKSPAKK